MLGAEGAEGRVEFFKKVKGLAAGAAGDEGNLATLHRFVAREEEAVKEHGGLNGRMGGGEEAGRQRGVEGVGFVEEREVERTGREEFLIYDS